MQGVGIPPNAASSPFARATGEAAGSDDFRENRPGDG